MLTSQHDSVVDVELLGNQVAARRDEQGALSANGVNSVKKCLCTGSQVG
jgi:hypothetical protein